MSGPRTLQRDNQRRTPEQASLNSKHVSGKWPNYLREPAVAIEARENNYAGFNANRLRRNELNV